ncbi:hypothetical protein HGM15179_010293 [Zosterops borbonicus]|uniref:Reverse transcriptase RNase H-like domain-containing protein n=1 Tax=Zosterops borbonicus TaxID=364589 RepID=A0A8K1GDL8_9PASS|nr:hypothetical protein HGM15179_010293 [Zosterops borbonicus]
MTAPVLTLPNVNKEFQLFVDVSEQTAQGVLTQEWASKRKPIGFLSKILDPVSQGWPTCLQAIVAVALLVEEARKITFKASLIVYTPHDVRNILQQKAKKWLTDSRLLKYEAILISSLGLELKTTSAQNPAQFMFGDPSEELLQDCAKIVELQTKVVKEKRKSEYPVVDGKTKKVVKSGPLRPEWSAQACELYALLKALKRAESNLLGAPLFETLNRQRREIRRELPVAGGNQQWGEEEWPAERIIEYYGPATWVNNGSWGYRTPIYLLNRLIRLQAVVEVVSNHTSDALELLAKQHSQMRAFVYQNGLALDYLLAEERGVCGKFNESECIEIDDYEETIKGLAQEIKKVVHVPVQKWNSILQASWWDQLFGQGEW